MRGVLVTGTDTDVGKTFVSGLIARQLVSHGVRPGVYKPACSGARLIDGLNCWDDLNTLSEASGIDDIDSICPQRFVAPLAPPVAARCENSTVDWQLIKSGFDAWRSRADFVLVEGVGGLLCPLTDSHSMADFAMWAGLPAVIVARVGLGTLNHTLLTVEAAERRGLVVDGVILNDPDNSAGSLAAETNVAELERLCSVPILGMVLFGGRSIELREPVLRDRIAWLREIDRTPV